MTADRLRICLAALQFPLDQRARTEVHRSVCEYVDQVKAEDCPPERMLIGLKRIAADSGITSNAHPTRESRASRAELLMDMVAWSIERYYAPTERGS
jgi:hypothetical protein